MNYCMQGLHFVPTKKMTQLSLMDGTGRKKRICEDCKAAALKRRKEDLLCFVNAAVLKSGGAMKMARMEKRAELKDVTISIATIAECTTR